MKRTHLAILPLILAIGLPAQDKSEGKTKATPPRYDAGLTCVHWVTDLDKSIAFYTGVLGFELLYKLPEMGWCELQTPVPGVCVGLGRQEKVTAGGGATLTWGVLDIEESAARLKQAGVKTAEIETIPDLVRLLRFADPDGNGLQLYQALGKAPKEAEGFEAVRFLTGSWRGKHQGGRVEEHWMDAGGGTMVGMSRTVSGAGKTFFEYLRIDKTKDGLVYQASPGGKKPVPFKLVENGKHKVVFENLEHDFPQRIRYWLDEAGNLRARVEDKEGKKGEDFVFQRAGLKAKG
jgi:catechol 2,3-dioxygenase-like lactoylglutathione lyase family enzyme